MRRALLIFFLLIPATACDDGWKGKGLAGFYAKVIKVKSADTLKVLVGGQREGYVKLFGVDAPGLFLRCHPQAKEFVGKLVLGKKVMVNPVRYEGKYLIAKVTTIDGNSLAHELVKRGFARVFVENFPSNRDAAYLDFAELQRDAINGSLGIWGSSCE